MGCDHKCNVAQVLENYFDQHGRFVARRPVLVILLSLAFTGLCATGLVNFHWESNAIKLWIPQDSDFAQDYDYLWSTHPPELRFHSIIFTTQNSDNILQPKYIRQMYKVRKKISGIRIQNRSWENHCFRVPVVKLELSAVFGGSRRKREDFFGQDFDNQFDDLDPSVEFYPKPFCDVVEDMKTTCFENSLLELWAHDGSYDQTSDDRISHLTTETILRDVNSKNTSGLMLVEKNFKDVLGGLELDSDGRIVSAKAMFLSFVGKMNATQAKLDGIDLNNALGEYVDSDTLVFEKALIEALTNTSEYEDGLESYPNVARSFSDIASSTIFSDVSMVVLGFGIVFTYVIFMLGKFDCVHSRIWLSLAGLFSVFMSIMASYGICCSLGFAFSPLHNFIPFLLMGLGIDDMFVILQSWSNYSEGDKEKDNVYRFGVAMKHAGVAITVTSLTDVLAFIIGATTVLPALKSFCVYCGMGILIVYVLQTTWFLAWMVLDQQRIEDGRSGFMPCVKCGPGADKCCFPERKSTLDICFMYYSQMVVSMPFKVMVIILTLVTMGISIWGNLLLSQEFDPIWFLPKDSYLFKWAMANDRYFPRHGEQNHVFMADLDLPRELSNVDFFVNELKASDDIVDITDDWYTIFGQYYSKHFKSVDGEELERLSDSVYRQRMTQFLFSPSGSKYRFMFQYADQLICGDPAPDITMLVMEFAHKNLSGPADQISAMMRVKDMISQSNFSGKVFAFSKEYAAWETDQVITAELYRNLVLAFGCITITTLILLSNWLACVLVLFCVVLTVANVAGFMHFWGLTIDTVSCTNLIICIGVCVDYAAHITHAFLTVEGNLNARVQVALRNIGPAVLNGGISTFLSFILLADSNSHVFDTFFKIFCLVVVFALFNALVFLPVLLSFIGPKPQLGQGHQDQRGLNKANGKTGNEEPGLEQHEMSELNASQCV